MSLYERSKSPSLPSWGTKSLTGHRDEQEIESSVQIKKHDLKKYSNIVVTEQEMISLKPLCLMSFLASFTMPLSVLAIPTNVPSHGTAFAQLSSLVDQQPGGFIQFESKDSLLNTSATINSVTVKQNGSYLVIASPQVTATKDGGCLDAWIVLNGKDVANSGVRICQAKAGNTNVVVSQVIMYLKTGDTLQVKTGGVNAKLDAIKAKQGPAIPSVILSVVGLY
jgi:hypothetical protein